MNTPARSVAIPGAFSFTGLWIARALGERGWKVDALGSSAEKDYSGLRGERVRALRGSADQHFGIPLESERMLRWIEERKPEVWVHHAFYMKDFRLPGYDAARAEELCIAPLPQLVDALVANGCRGVIYSGSYFEPGEGGTQAPPTTPYAKSKALAWEELRRLCSLQGLPLSKIVIPNPIGPLENEDRLIPTLLKKAQPREGDAEEFRITSPRDIADHLPVMSLASVYADVADRLARGEEQVLRPSGWISETEVFVQTICSELIEKRLGWKPPRITLAPVPGVAPVIRRNGDPVPVDLPGLWDAYAASARSVAS